MKRLLIASAIVFMGLGAHAQSGQFKIGVNVGLPVGDAADFSSFTAGADAAYLWNVAPSFQVGPTVGFQNYFIKGDLKDLGVESFNYIPLAASAQYSVAPEFFIGADLGYGLVTSKGGSGGGFYYMPKIGYQKTTWEAYAGYRGISDDGSVSAVNIGVNFKF